MPFLKKSFNILLRCNKMFFIITKSIFYRLVGTLFRNFNVHKNIDCCGQDLYLSTSLNDNVKWLPHIMIDFGNSLVRFRQSSLYISFERYLTASLPYALPSWKKLAIFSFVSIDISFVGAIVPFN